MSYNPKLLGYVGPFDTVDGFNGCYRPEFKWDGKNRVAMRDGWKLHHRPRGRGRVHLTP